MSRTTVVGYDGSLGARAALTRAASRVGNDGRLIVAQVARVPTEYLEMPYYDDALRHARERAEDVLEQVRETLPEGVDAKLEVHEGPPARTLVDLARSEQADDLAIGSRGFGPLGAAALGSTSHALLHEADRPVLVMTTRAAEREVRRHAVNGERRDGPTIIVGYDGSDHARAALEYAAKQAGDGGRLVAVLAYDPPSEWLGHPYYGRAVNEHQELGRKQLAELESGADLGVELETDLLEGPPARALVRAAEARDATEIVVGTRGLGRFRGALGSVAHALLHEAECALVVVPLPDR
jgi:nucleotide-binding universal stress UspA family protein